MVDKNPFHNQSMFKGAPPSSFEKAKLLRKNMTSAERHLWSFLRNKKLEGYVFRRQHPIHLFIVDFYCHQVKLVIEVDGDYHNSNKQKIKDDERTKLLEFQDLTIIRFTNDQVSNSIQRVLKEIETSIKNIPL